MSWNIFPVVGWEADKEVAPFLRTKLHPYYGIPQQYDYDADAAAYDGDDDNDGDDNGDDDDDDNDDDDGRLSHSKSVRELAETAIQSWALVSNSSKDLEW